MQQRNPPSYRVVGCFSFFFKVHVLIICLQSALKYYKGPNDWIVSEQVTLW